MPQEPPYTLAESSRLGKQAEHKVGFGLEIVEEPWLHQYARIVEQASLRRRLIGAAGRIAGLGYDESLEAEKALEEAEQVLFKVAERRLSRDFQKLADVLLHDALPVLYLIFWFVFVEKSRLRWMDAFRWLAFPGVYFGYVLLRGALTGWYPYPFLDAGDLGYGGMARSTVMLVIAFLAVALTFVAIAKWLNRRAGSKMA